jgi:hypothetical protein
MGAGRWQASGERTKELRLRRSLGRSTACGCFFVIGVVVLAIGWGRELSREALPPCNVTLVAGAPPAGAPQTEHQGAAAAKAERLAAERRAREAEEAAAAAEVAAVEAALEAARMEAAANVSNGTGLGGSLAQNATGGGVVVGRRRAGEANTSISPVVGLPLGSIKAPRECPSADGSGAIMMAGGVLMLLVGIFMGGIVGGLRSEVVLFRVAPWTVRAAASHAVRSSLPQPGSISCYVKWGGTAPMPARFNLTY